MVKSREALARWKLQQKVSRAVEKSRAECVRRGIPFDEAYAARLMNGAGRAVILDDEARPGKKGGA